MATLDRILFLTNGCTQGRAMLGHLLRSEFGPRVHVAYVQLPSVPFRQRVRAQYEKGGLPRIVRMSRKRLLSTRYWAIKLGLLPEIERVYRCPWPAVDEQVRDPARIGRFTSFDAPPLLELMRGVAPDVLILGGAPILKRPVFSIARLGTVNVHPGDIPHYRGLDCVFWTLRDGAPLRVTAHFIDHRIDMGEILAKRDVSYVGQRVPEILARCDETAGELLCSVLEGLDRGTVQQIRVTEKGNLCGSMGFLGIRDLMQRTF